MAERPCTIDGCDRPVRARGWCTRHYQRWQRTGDPTKLRGPLTIDARPLVEAIERRRVRIAGVLDAADARAYYRARQTGTITDAAADRIAVRALGLTLTEIYGDAEPLEVAS